MKMKKKCIYRLPIANNRQSTEGFTLLELILVMAILAILTTALWGNFFSSIIKGRDSRRKQDLESISKALELYYSDIKAYPTASTGNQDDYGLAWGAPFLHPQESTVVYMQKLPADPSSPNQNYCYISDGTSFRLYANLENLSDPKLIPAPQPTCPANEGESYNYGISSSNIQP
ncbi:hypothetical protein A2Y99_03660 [Candidatus Gottesmanbacteria bacterium RBG_13_37_7]|uniref:Type II secretion system protein GspG C-terminal domain-containing protein n=1 Tax=Candidatus Gottesmanbacteria bacterium RBG_13_37_7 TaxID=1798369 RepID=A0A1F5YIW9_9BACT|nr:MAG: hypothetical protein A2Y99_03660 [Candidatus Gottesmanbacteria bacterium RBG_13_37_7]